MTDSVAAAAANDNLLGNALFPSLENAAAADSRISINELQDEDPLAAQVWKFFSKTKQQLPNQQRLENLTWRMMALSMRKQKQEEDTRLAQNRFVQFAFTFSFLFLAVRFVHPLSRSPLATLYRRAEGHMPEATRSRGRCACMASLHHTSWATSHLLTRGPCPPARL